MNKQVSRKGTADLATGQRPHFSSCMSVLRPDSVIANQKKSNSLGLSALKDEIKDS